MGDTARSRDMSVVGGGILLILAIAGWSFFRSNMEEKKDDALKTPDSEMTLPNDAQRISIDDLRPLVLGKVSSNNTVILDTRPRSLFEEEHGIGFRSMPLEDLKKNLSLPTEIKDPTIILLSENDQAAAQAFRSLEERGVSKDRVRIFDGTFETWKKETGLTVKKADPTSPIDATKVRLVTPEQAKEKIGSGGSWFLLDIRDPHQFDRGHIAGATNIPFTRLEEYRFNIPSLGTILVYGDNDRESFSGGVLLFDLGFFNTFTLSSGFDEWEKKNFPTQKKAEK
ncbi:MAG: hypothetical protein IPL87_03310 [Candidatus Moraniibacteriota bacterium]|nr:MAG: hypothetical protein IPL87_03310 [Candidatus Moranbacteria bacterium]